MDIDCLCAGILFADHVCSPVPRVPGAGEVIVADKMQLCLGGCSSNAALDLTRLGVRTAVAGCVGDDAFGRFIVETLDDGGVQTDDVRRVAGVNSASTMIINISGQDRRFICGVGANVNFSVDHIPTDLVAAAKVLYLGGYFMLPGLETAEMVDLFRAARAAGTRTVLDVVYDDSPDSWDRLAPLLGETDVFLPNDDEARLLTGLEDPVKQAERFRDAGAETVVITMGEKGSLLMSDGLCLTAGTYPSRFVGGTGAGDAFDAGFIAAMIDDADHRDCLRWGTAMGASCVRAAGATESVFNRQEAEAMISEHILEMKEV